MTIRIEIDGTATEVAPGTTVLEAVRALDGYVPVLCFDDRQDPFGACRVCMVGVAGAPGPVAACTARCRDGMVVD
ncbi:MAG: 2Fe-2S iron-sulfur cluster-binding protein, partial [Solirubrobacteraceae bacterium]